MKFSRYTIAGIGIISLISGFFFVNYTNVDDKQSIDCTSPTATKNIASPVTKPEDDIEKQKKYDMETKLFLFEDKLSEYCRKEQKRASGKPISWRRYISNSSSLSNEQRKANLDIWNEFISLLKDYKKYDFIPDRRTVYYSMIFDVDSFKPSTEERDLMIKVTDWDEKSFAYITEVVDLGWYAEKIRYSYYISRDMIDEEPLSNLPEALKEVSISERERLEKAKSENSYRYDMLVHPARGVAHLVGYYKERCDDFGGETIKILMRHFDSIEGKDFGDIGSGCGFTAGLFREKIGKNADLYLNDLDGYTCHLLKFMAKGSNAKIIQGDFNNCNFKRDSVDIINMTGVHMGDFMSRLREPWRVKYHTIPWLKSMHDALRPKGVLVINDGDRVLLDPSFRLDETIESCGFRKLDMIESPSGSTFTLLYEVDK